MHCKQVCCASQQHTPKRVKMRDAQLILILTINHQKSRVPYWMIIFSTLLETLVSRSSTRSLMEIIHPMGRPKAYLQQRLVSFADDNYRKKIAPHIRELVRQRKFNRLTRGELLRCASKSAGGPLIVPIVVFCFLIVWIILDLFSIGLRIWSNQGLTRYDSFWRAVGDWVASACGHP